MTGATALDMLHSLGPRPPWWRPFKRLAFDRAFHRLFDWPCGQRNIRPDGLREECVLGDEHLGPHRFPSGAIMALKKTPPP